MMLVHQHPLNTKPSCPFLNCKGKKHTMCVESQLKFNILIHKVVVKKSFLYNRNTIRK